MVTAYTDSVDPLLKYRTFAARSIFGAPMPVPTNGDHNLPTSAPDNRLYASDFDIGGEGISYHDTEAVNQGDAYRPSEGVDIQASSENHTNVGWFESNEWLEFTIDVAEAGNYIITYRTASPWDTGKISFESNFGSRCEKLTEVLST